MIKFPIKLILTLLFFTAILLLFCLRDLMTYALVGVAAVVVGTFAYPLVFISENKGKIVVFAIIFYPFTILVGIFSIARDLYRDVGGAFMEEMVENCESGLTGIWIM